VVRSAPRVAVGGQRDSPAHVAAPLQEARDGAQRRATESTGKGGGCGRPASAIRVLVPDIGGGPDAEMPTNWLQLACS